LNFHASPSVDQPARVRTGRNGNRPEYQRFANVERRNFLQANVEVPTLVRALRLPAGRDILEVGCGRGIALAPLYRLCSPGRLVGLDIDPALVELATRHVGLQNVPAELHVGDVRALPFDSASFDIIIDFGTCYHIARPEQALSEIVRVLRAGGLFVHETPVSQLLAHPVRAFGRTLPWTSAHALVRQRSALFWASRTRNGPAVGR
jgi:ubiquinone/menaquinone biosynthesis C-methylase UbiE